MDFIAINKATWDKRTALHLDSQFYDVEKFKAGGCSLNPIELAQVGDVQGKKLLHLQCHFGQDTLSWARRGANVTGVDLSSEAVKSAQSLAKELNLAATFIESDVCRFQSQESFDLVFTSYGVLCWLEDLDAWAKTVAAALKQGGYFHLVEFHPFVDLLSGYSYFPQLQPDIEFEGTYTENCTGETSQVVTWPHSISQVIQALIRVGLVIEQFDEHVYCPYDCFDGLQALEGKGFQKLHLEQQLPLLYSIKARKA